MQSEAIHTCHSPGTGTSQPPKNFDVVKNLTGPIDVNTNGDDNQITVETHLDGSVSVTVDGESVHFTAQEAARGLIINAGSGNDNIRMTGQAFGGNPPIKINGGDGNDVIKGGDADYRIHAGRGDDIIVVGHGNNHIEGEDGNDSILAGNGNNVIKGGNANDQIVAGSGNNRILAGRGNDDILVGNGDNYIEGEDGDDEIHAGHGTNHINSGNGNDRVNVGDGTNRIYAGRGNDNITAGNGDNYIEGEDGNDRIRVGTGKGTVSGGRGDDTFVMTGGDYDVRGGEGHDKITGETPDEPGRGRIDSRPYPPQDVQVPYPITINEKEFDLMSFLSEITDSIGISMDQLLPVDIEELKEILGELNVVDIVGDLLADALQQVGEMLGLPQSVIDLAQAAMRSGLGDIQGMIEELKEAVEHNDFGTPNKENLSASDREYLSRQTDEISALLMNIINQMIEENSRKNGSGKNGKESKGGSDARNFFEALAEAMGEMLGQQAKELMEAADTLKSSGGEGQEAAQAFAKAQTDYQAENQIFSMIMQTVNTTMKVVGEGLSTLPKRN